MTLNVSAEWLVMGDEINLKELKVAREEKIKAEKQRLIDMALMELELTKMKIEKEYGVKL